MAIELVGWIQRKLRVDISGEGEYERNLWVDHMTKTLDEEHRRVETRLRELKLELANLIASTHCENPNQKLISVCPGKLYFPIPLNKYILNTVTARNVCDHNIAFKIKATAPVRYAVKPHNGFLAPNSEMEIRITLRPTTENPNSLHDKFLIESRVLTSEETAQYQSGTLSSVSWKDGKFATYCVKIRCRFTAELPANFVLKSSAECAATSTSKTSATSSTSTSTYTTSTSSSSSSAHPNASSQSSQTTTDPNGLTSYVPISVSNTAELMRSSAGQAPNDPLCVQQQSKSRSTNRDVSVSPGGGGGGGMDDSGMGGSSSSMDEMGGEDEDSDDDEEQRAGVSDQSRGDEPEQSSNDPTNQQCGEHSLNVPPDSSSIMMDGPISPLPPGLTQRRTHNRPSLSHEDL